MLSSVRVCVCVSCCSCFCTLLERLHLLDALWGASRPGSMPLPFPACEDAAEIEPAVPASEEELLQRPPMTFMQQLEANLQGLPGLDAVLAALISHAQQHAAAPSTLGPTAAGTALSAKQLQDGGAEIACLAAAQEQHSAARALPLLLRLYFNTGTRAEVCLLPA